MQDRHQQRNRHGQFWLSLGLVAIASNPLWVVLGSAAGAIATVAAVTPAQAAALTQWRFDTVSQQLEVTIPPGTTPRYFLLAQPTRIVMDLPNIDMGAVSGQETYSGAVRQIRVSQFEPGLTRIVLELSPDAVLAPGQVQLRQLTATNNASARWALRPLLEAGSGDSAATSSSPVAPSQTAIASPSVSTPAVPPVSPESPASSPTGSATPDDLQGRSPSSLLTTEPASIGNVPSSTSSGLPPLEPGRVETAVESAPAPAASQFPAAVNANPTASAPSSSPVASDWQIPPALPPALPQTGSSSMVTVPPLGSTASVQPAPSQSVPSQSVPSQSVPSQSVPSQPTALPPGQSAVVPSAVEPSQPVPVRRSPTIAAAPSNPNLLLPSGTALNLRYPRQTALTLNPDAPWQEVLVLDQPVLDFAGNVVFPTGSQVIGRFETSSDGSQFIAQAISVGDRNLRLDAESGMLGGDRQVSNRNLIRNSALGAIGVTVLGVLTGGIGLLGLAAGAATGAATTYITAPQPATIQPNQIVEVRLTRDILR